MPSSQNRVPNSEKSPGRRTAAPVIRLETPAPRETRMGRPRKLEMPPLPQELLDGFTELEREHFQFFLDAFRQDYGIKKPSDEIALFNAACEYIQLLRVNATSAKTGEVITAARQHPGVQLRAWLDSMGSTRKQRKDQGEADTEKDEWVKAMSKLSAG